VSVVFRGRVARFVCWKVSWDEQAGDGGGQCRAAADVQGGVESGQAGHGMSGVADGEGGQDGSEDGSGGGGADVAGEHVESR